MRRSQLAMALVAGALTGTAGAAVRAQETAPAPTPVATPAPVKIPIEQRRRGRLPDGRYVDSMAHYRVHRPRVVARIDDPDGGPAWALKVFDAERITLKRPARTLAGGRVVGRDRCVQLGRVQGDEFGWVFGDGRFRRTGIEDQLLQCGPRKRPVALAAFASALTIADPAAPTIARSVAWGLAPGDAPVTISGTGGADGAATVRAGAFLHVGGPEARVTADARVVVGRHTVWLTPRRSHFPPQSRRRINFPTLVPGSERIEAPAPDPSGGPRYGMAVAETREGVPCVTGPVRVVEGRGGAVDLRLGLFTSSALVSESCRPLETQQSEERLCDVGRGFGNAEELEIGDAFTKRARTERRLLSGRTSIYGQCKAEVERVTIRTPRDIRTLVPSAVGHAFLAVYDGGFVDGESVITAHLRGGRTWTERHPLGGF